MKKDSITYKLLKFADTQAYAELHFSGITSACNIVTGLIKAFFVALIYLMVVAGIIAMVSSILWILGSILLFLSMPILEMIGVVDWFSVSSYESGSVLTAFFLLVLPIAASINTLNGDMKAVPDWMKSTKTQSNKTTTPHWITLALKGWKDKVCYFVKLED